ncbi:uncharacterized protein LOC129370975 isoform X2 [Poeciliopsis prolifica]|uniref:uncharacterized protein LOC129370975 isoform X2 n=1 Tax=Poeciliopsis prolifica TaxID=188132 RepID=UPI002412F623|nr:uncharacterized protein LOC129370975 isoform X2 [Poeciliopsis prolifica]
MSWTKTAKTKKCLSQNAQKFFELSSATPLCANLIYTAVYNPGKHFSPLQMSQVQVELRESELSTDLGNDYQTSYLLEAVLDWLNLSVRDMDMLTNSEKTCRKWCWLDKSKEIHCSNCKSVFKRKHFLSKNEVIVLFLHRSARCWSATVIANPTIDVPGQNGIHQYHLSSIICRDPELINFYTYLIRGQHVFKADDNQVITASGQWMDDINERGFVYIYEKQKSSAPSFPALPLQASFLRQQESLMEVVENMTETAIEGGGTIVREKENELIHQNGTYLSEYIHKNIYRLQSLLFILFLLCVLLVIICFFDFYMFVFFLISVCGVTLVLTTFGQVLEAVN